MAKSKKSKVRITRPLWGKFLMPYPVGSDVSLDAKMASVLIKEGFAIPAVEAAKIDAAAQDEDAADQQGTE